MARIDTSAEVDSKRRRMADKAHGPGRRNARQAATRRNEVVEAQAVADPTVSTADRSRTTRSLVEDGNSCRDGRERRGSPAVTTASASRARVDAAAIEGGRVPSATGTSTRKAKRAAAGTSRATESRVSARAKGSGAAGTTRKPPLAGRASAAKKSSGISRTARRRP